MGVVVSNGSILCNGVQSENGVPWVIVLYRAGSGARLSLEWNGNSHKHTKQGLIWT